MTVLTLKFQVFHLIIKNNNKKKMPLAYIITCAICDHTEDNVDAEIFLFMFII